MGIKSIFIQWPDALGGGGRLLDNLAKFTNFNTVELSNFYIDWFQRTPHGERVPLALPSNRSFKTPIPVMQEARFPRLGRLMNDIHNKGFRVACNFTPLYVGVGQESGLSIVDADDNRTPGVRRYLAYGCPNNPTVLGYARTAIREHIRTWPGLDHICINHAEYPFWPRTSGIDSLFTCFCESCRRCAAEQGLDFDRMKREVKELGHRIQRRRPGKDRITTADATPSDLVNLMAERPYAGEWLHFRLSSMSRFLTQVIQEGRAAARDHSSDVRIGLEFQLPSLSRLVGTDYAELCNQLDWMAPKFPEYLGGTVIPLVAQTLAKRKGRKESVPELMAILRRWLDIGDGPAQYVPIENPEEELLFANTFDASVIGLQMKHLRAILGRVEVYPYLWEYNHDLVGLGEKIARIRQLGFSGYFMTCWYQDIAPLALEAGVDTFKLL